MLIISVEAGYKALFLSVDVPVLGKRLNEYRNDYTLPESMQWPNILSSGSDHSDRTDYGLFTVSRVYDLSLLLTDPSLDWESTIPWLREHTSLPIWLKGGKKHDIPWQRSLLMSGPLQFVLPRTWNWLSSMGLTE